MPMCQIKEKVAHWSCQDKIKIPIKEMVVKLMTGMLRLQPHRDIHASVEVTFVPMRTSLFCIRF